MPELDDEKYQPGACAKSIAWQKKEGGKPADLMRSGALAKHPKAKDADGVASIPFSEADAICTAFEAQIKVVTALVSIQRSAEYMEDKKGLPTAETVSGYNVGAAENIIKRGKTCLATVDGMIRAGKPAKLKVGSKEISLEETKKICKSAVDYGTAFEALLVEEQKAKKAEISKKYEAAGIKGARLALFVEYDDVFWRVKGCEKTDDVAVLKKATVLFQWLENSDGTHTIRKYQFAGDKIKSKTDKTYRFEEQAYKGCK
ncbi:MAG: hypothetical protein ACKV2T_28915 [Kofleriaceae bacterium]